MTILGSNHSQCPSTSPSTSPRAHHCQSTNSRALQREMAPRAFIATCRAWRALALCLFLIWYLRWYGGHSEVPVTTKGAIGGYPGLLESSKVPSGAPIKRLGAPPVTFRALPRRSRGKALRDAEESAPCAEVRRCRKGPPKGALPDSFREQVRGLLQPMRDAAAEESPGAFPAFELFRPASFLGLQL